MFESMLETVYSATKSWFTMKTSVVSAVLIECQVIVATVTHCSPQQSYIRKAIWLYCWLILLSMRNWLQIEIIKTISGVSGYDAPWGLCNCGEPFKYQLILIVFQLIRSHNYCTVYICKPDNVCYEIIICSRLHYFFFPGWNFSSLDNPWGYLFSWETLFIMSFIRNHVTTLCRLSKCLHCQERATIQGLIL